MSKFREFGCNDWLAGAQIFEKFDRIRSVRQGCLLEGNDTRVEYMQVRRQRLVKLFPNQLHVSDPMEWRLVSAIGAANEHEIPIRARSCQISDELRVKPIGDCSVVTNNRVT